MEEFWEVLVAIKTACEYAGVQVITGDTKVVERGKVIRYSSTLPALAKYILRHQ